MTLMTMENGRYTSEWNQFRLRWFLALGSFLTAFAALIFAACLQMSGRPSLSRLCSVDSTIEDPRRLLSPLISVLTGQL